MSNIWILGFVSFFTDLGTYMVYPLVPLFLASVGTTPFVIGIIEGVAESLTSLLQFVFGYTSDRIKKRKSLAIFGYGLSAFGRGLLVLSTSWVGVFFWRLSDRIGKGIRTAPRDALIAESGGKKRHGRSFGLHQMMDMTGAALGVLIAYLILKQGEGQYSTVFLYSLLPVALGLLIVFFVKETKETFRPANEGSDSVLRKPKFEFKWSLLDPELKRLLLVVLLFTLANSSNQFLILRASNLGVSATDALLLYLLFHLTGALFAYPMGRLSDWIGRRGLLTTGYLLYGVVYLGFALIESAKWVGVLFALYGVYSGLTKGVEKALVADAAPDHLKATMMGMYAMFVAIGLLPASLIAGWLWDRYGASAPFYFNGLLALVTAFLLYRVLSKQPARQV